MRPDPDPFYVALAPGHPEDMAWNDSFGGRILVAPPDRSADPVGIQAISNRMKYDGKATEVLLS